MSNDTFRLLTSQALSYSTPCYMFGDIRACYKINEIENFARELCASGDAQACAALEKITEIKFQGEFAKLALSVSYPVL